MWSNFQVDISILNTTLMLANFGLGVWPQVPGVGPGFYSFPFDRTSQEQSSKS